MFEIIVFLIVLTLVHFLVPIIRVTHIFPLGVVLALGSGVAITHWILFTPTLVHQYALVLTTQFFPSKNIAFISFLIFMTVLSGFVILLWIDSIIYNQKTNRLTQPSWIYSVKMLTIFGFNYSTAYSVPTAAFTKDKEIYIYFLDAVVYYILADLSISKAFPHRYKFKYRIISILGVFAGVATGYLGMNHADDWFMAWVDAFFHGCCLFLITKSEFTTWDTEKYFLFFIIGVVLSSAMMFLYQ